MTSRLTFALVAALAIAGCSKKEEKAGGGAAAPTAKSGLPWTPDGYDAMTPTCKKALACCEEVATAAGAKSAEDYNMKCSGPALWKEDECATDLKARVAGFEAESKPVPEACK